MAPRVTHDEFHDRHTITHRIYHEYHDDRPTDDATQITQDSVQKDPEPDRRASQPKTKRQSNYRIIGENHEEGVVEWYRQHELLYNKKMRAYRDRDKKAQAWATKAQSTIARSTKEW